jgi:outer membrane protein TolC
MTTPPGGDRRAVLYPRERPQRMGGRRTVRAASLLVSIIALRSEAQDTLRLAELQQAAVARDPRMTQSRLFREQADLRVSTLRAERLPTFAAAAQAQHQSDITSLRVPGVRPPFKDTYDANLGVRLRVLDPSRGPRVVVEEAQLAESDARVSTAVFGQRQAVSDAWFAVRTLDAQRQVVETAITDLEAQLRTARERIAAGAALPGDAASIEAEVIRRRQSIAEIDANREAALTMLRDLTGRRIDSRAALLTPDLTAAVQRARPLLDSLRVRPEYRLYAASRELTAAREQALHAQDKPRLAAFTRAGYGRPGLNMLARDFDTYWLAGVQLEWSPFDWGTARREREVLRLQRDVIASEERAFVERIRRATIADLATIDRLQQTLADDEAIIQLRLGIVREARIRHSEGVITSAELVDRDTDLQAARLMLATHRVEMDQARARFLTTIGLEVR